MKNSLLPIVVPREIHGELFRAVEANPQYTVTVDLAAQKLVLPDGRAVEFPVDAFSKHCLLEGVDELGYIQQHEAEIAAYEARRAGTVNTLTAA